MSAPSALALESFDFFSQAIVARSPEMIKESADKFLTNAIKRAVFAEAREDNQAKFLSIFEMDSEELLISSKVGKKLTTEDMKDILAGFMLAKGALNESKYWIYVERIKCFVAFPDLAAKTFHGAAQWALAERMSNLIKSGRSSNLLDFLSRGGIEVDNKFRHLMFAKGYTLAANRENALALKADIGAVIRSMEENKGINPPSPKFSPSFVQISRRKMVGNVI